MKTVDTAVNYVYSLLTGLEAPDINVYKYVKPDNLNLTEYIVINSLPINAGVMQKAYVNVNFHCQDMAEGIPNMQRLEEVTADLVDLLEQVDGTDILIDFESQEYIREQLLKEHYCNIRLSVKLINS